MKSPKTTAHGYIAVCSRGLVHSRTMQACCALQRRHGWNVQLTHDLPIPEAQNEIIRRILSDTSAEWILFVEEDIVPPLNIIDACDDLQLVQSVDYNLEGGNKSINRIGSNREILFSGMGCLLVAASVFRRLKAPWFAIGEFGIDRDDGVPKLKPTPGNKDFGGQDISFCYSLQQAGIPIHHLRHLQAQHLRVKRMGQRLTNQGCHHIEEL